MTQMIVAPTQSVIEATPEEIEDFAEFDRASRAESTRKTYLRLLDGWHEYCAGKQASPCPADPYWVWQYLRKCYYANLAASTLTSIKAAIQFEHGEHSAPDPFSGSTEASQRLIKQLAGMRKKRQRTRRPRRAAGLGPEQFEALLGAVDVDKPTGLRDAAMLCIGLCNANRRSELTSLLIEDVQWNESGATIYLEHSKTDQDGHGATLVAPSIDALIDPAGYLRGWVGWLAEHGIKNGPIFRETRHSRRKNEWWPVNTGSIADAVSGDWFNTLIKRYATAAQVKPDKGHISAHSLRRSAALWLARKGYTGVQIAQMGRWMDPRTVQTHYLENDADERMKMAQSAFGNN